MIICYTFSKILFFGKDLNIMKLQQVQEILSAKVLSGTPCGDVNSACGCDLMSDVLAFVKDKALLLTGLMNPQVVRTAEMMDITTIVFVRGKQPDQAIIDLAESKNIVLMSTQYPLYIACGMLYEKGLGNEGGKA